MIIILGIIFSAILAKISGGHFSNLLDNKIKKPGFILLAVIFQTIPRLFGLNGFRFFTDFGIVFLMISLCFMLYAFWVNRHQLGLLITGFGFTLNALVIAFNHGKMPVDKTIASKADFDFLFNAIKNGQDIKHVFLDENSRLPFLSDLFYIPAPLLSPKPELASIGDIIVFLGVFVLFFCMMRSPKDTNAG